MHLNFFFQAEDGIRDGRVTGVQTCALPISHLTLYNWSGPVASEAGQGQPSGGLPEGRRGGGIVLDMPVLVIEPVVLGDVEPDQAERAVLAHPRSEERRVGKECRCRGEAEQ